MTLDPEHISFSDLQEAIIKPKADGQMHKNKQMYVCLELTEIHTKQSQAQGCSDYVRHASLL